MKQIVTLTLAMVFMALSGAVAQNTLKGTVKDLETGVPLPMVQVTVSGTTLTAQTGRDGGYVIVGVPEGKRIISFSLNGYQSNELEVDITGNIILPDIMLKSTPIQEGEQTFNEITVTLDDLEDAGKDQAISGLLQSSNDAFGSAVAYTFSPARFRVRGYDSDYTYLYMNGIPTNDPVRGYASWSSWGGLNDATRNKEYHNGLTPSDWSFGGLGGATNIITRASQQRIGTKVSYASTNRTYSNRVMFTHSTGLMENGTALTVSGSRRWATEGYVEGTNYDAWAYFVSLEKRFNNNHSVAFTTFNAPIKRAMQGLATEEANELAGSNYYNPNWGYQNGEKRNAKVRFQQEPTFILNHYWNINDKLKLTTTAGYTFGTYQTTALNWYNAQDPRPDYYRKLPSYWLDAEQSVRDQIADAFRTNPAVRQIDWNYLYQVNYNSLDKESNMLRSKYIVENRITDSRQFTFSSVANWNPIPGMKLNGGIELSVYKGRSYKKVDDLLGGEFWLDIDQFIERDFFNNPELAQNDLDNPNRKVTVGDVMGYDYTANVNNGNVWGVANFSGNRFDYYLGGSYSYTEFWRTGHMRNGRFPNNSKGDADKQQFHNYGIKGGATWKITGRHYLSANTAYLTRAPFFRNSYISPRTSNFVVDGLTDEIILSGDINYNLRTPYIKARFTAYYTRFTDQTKLKSYYDDYYRTFINYTMRNIDKVHKGFELGAEIKITPTISINMAAAAGTYQYDSRPLATVTQDNLGTILAKDQVVYIKNFYVPNTPQTAAMLGLRYASPKYWYLGANISYFDDMYIDFAPGKRTAEALIGLDANDPRREELTRQIGVSSAYLVNANIGKSWKIKSYYINLNFQVTNLLDNTDFRTGGFEQSRFSIADQTSNKFPPKYFYAYGRTYYLILGLRF